MLILQGQSVLSSDTVLGMVFKRGVEGEVARVNGAKIAVYTCPFDIATTETKVCLTFNVDERILICLIGM